MDEEINSTLIRFYYEAMKATLAKLRDAPDGTETKLYHRIVDDSITGDVEIGQNEIAISLMIWMTRRGQQTEEAFQVHCLYFHRKMI